LHPLKTNTFARRTLASSLRELGLVLKRTGQPAEALAALEESLAVAQKMAAANPQVVWIQRELGLSHAAIGYTLQGMGPERVSKAEAEFRAAQAILEKLDDTDSLMALAASYNNLGNLLDATGRSSEAEAAYRKALVLKQRLVADRPANLDTRRRLGSGHRNLGLWLSRAGKPSEAEAEYRAALTHLQRVVDGDPADVEARGNLAATRSDLEKLLLSLADTRSKLGKDLLSMGKPAEALDSFRVACSVLERMPTPTTSQLYDLACYQALTAGAAADARSGRPVAEARAGADRAMATLHRAVAGGYRNLAHTRIDTDLDSLRSRDDFRLMMMDLAFPDSPFAAAR
jgi:tetratricopeptide (TPR) repeat protein